MSSISAFILFASLLAFISTAYANFNSSNSDNVAVYWGQNSYGQGTGSLAQQRLVYYCANTAFNIIPLAFLTVIADPALNFANAGNDCTLFSGTNLFSCPQLAADIVTCQTTYGKTILLSVGGSTYTEGGFATSAAAISAANNLWALFGPEVAGSSAPRPFGAAAVDGFDFDFESSVTNMVPFANQLRNLMDADTVSSGKEWLLTAAPQCPYPDAADNDMLNGQVFFDAIWVQFYNNYCGLQSFVASSVSQNNFNFATWDNWAKTVSKNPAVKVLLGVPGAVTAAGGGYEAGSALTATIAYCQQFSSFGGVMIWDMSQVYANSGFLDGLSSDLGTGGPVSIPNTKAPATTMQTLTMTTTAASDATTTTPASPGTVNQWNQCGGIGWTGGTVCVAPYTCIYFSIWYSQCE